MIRFGKTKQDKYIDFELNELIGKSMYVIGLTGSGKSYTAGTIIEQIIEDNGKVLIIDTEGDHEYIDGVWKATVHEPDNAYEIVNRIYKERASMWVNASSLTRSDLREFIKILSKELTERGFRERMPLFVAVDEAERFLEEGSSITEFTDLISLGRKRGIGVILSGHRIANIKKSVLSECRISLFKKMTLDNDIDRIIKYISSVKSLSKEDKQKLGSLVISMKQDKALIVNSETGEIDLITTMKRKYKHGGKTPTTGSYRSRTHTTTNKKPNPVPEPRVKKAQTNSYETRELSYNKESNKKSIGERINNNVFLIHKTTILLAILIIMNFVSVFHNIIIGSDFNLGIFLVIFGYVMALLTVFTINKLKQKWINEEKERYWTR